MNGLGVQTQSSQRDVKRKKGSAKLGSSDGEVRRSSSYEEHDDDMNQKARCMGYLVGRYSRWELGRQTG